MRVYRQSVSKNFLANDLTPTLSLKTLLTIALDTLRSFATIFIDLIGFLSMQLLMALTNLGVTTEGFFPNPGISFNKILFLALQIVLRDVQTSFTIYGNGAEQSSYLSGLASISFKKLLILSKRKKFGTIVFFR